MQNVFYKIKYEVNEMFVEKTYDNINDLKKEYDELIEKSKTTNIKLYIVNETEEELSIEQIPN